MAGLNATDGIFWSRMLFCNWIWSQKWLSCLSSETFCSFSEFGPFSKLGNFWENFEFFQRYSKNSSNFWQNETKISSLGHMEHPQISIQSWKIHFQNQNKFQIFKTTKILTKIEKCKFQVWRQIWGCSTCPRELFLVSFCQKLSEFL